jgi:hypothetical protein
MTASPLRPSQMRRKPFQEATVLHVVSQLRDDSGPRRFLVADEVGLGKTLVAQGVLQHLASARARSTSSTSAPASPSRTKTATAC